jgi:hypothetical protein
MSSCVVLVLTVILLSIFTDFVFCNQKNDFCPRPLTSAEIYQQELKRSREDDGLCSMVILVVTIGLLLLAAGNRTNSRSRR